MLKIKEKEDELKEAGRQKDFEKAKILWQRDTTNTKNNVTGFFDFF